jgi:hypothetical protein
MDEQIQQLNNRLTALEDRLNGVTNDPRQVAVIEREASKFGAQDSSKAADSENVEVQEAGTSTFDVVGPPDGFVEIAVGTATVNLPYYS